MIIILMFLIPAPVYFSESSKFYVFSRYVYLDIGFSLENSVSLKKKSSECMLNLHRKLWDINVGEILKNSCPENLMLKL